MEVGKKQFIVFTVEQEEFGIDINKVTIIERMLNITRVPKTPPYIRGVINLRGDIIPVMDIRERFGLPGKEEDEDTRIIIISIDQIVFGIIVDAVSEVLQFEETGIESVTGIVDAKGLEYISGVARTDKRLVALMNLEKLIAELAPV